MFVKYKNIIQCLAIFVKYASTYTVAKLSQVNIKVCKTASTRTLTHLKSSYIRQLNCELHAFSL